MPRPKKGCDEDELAGQLTRKPRAFLKKLKAGRTSRKGELAIDVRFARIRD